MELNLSGPVIAKKTVITETVKKTKRQIECKSKCDRRELPDGSGIICLGCGNAWPSPNWNGAT